MNTAHRCNSIESLFIKKAYVVNLVPLEQYVSDVEQPKKHIFLLKN